MIKISKEERDSIVAVMQNKFEEFKVNNSWAQDGFFFGSTHYDEYYWQDLLDTIEICKRALEVYDSHSSIYYKSSW